MKRPEFITLYVDDISVSTRVVEVPSRCECGADLLVEGALDHCEYQDQSRSASINTDGTVEWGNDLPQSGESYIALEWRCAECRVSLAAAEETRT